MGDKERGLGLSCTQCAAVLWVCLSSHPESEVSFSRCLTETGHGCRLAGSSLLSGDGGGAAKEEEAFGGFLRCSQFSLLRAYTHQLSERFTV